MLDDLAAEQGELAALVTGLAEQQWAVATPAEGWAVRDQISHLAFFDEAATSALTEPRRFAAEAEAALAGLSDGSDPMAEHLARGRALAGDQLLAWWDRARLALLSAAANADPAARVPWYGPAMSLRSFLSARLMETWAHGQDVADALGVVRRPTRRLVHVAQLGVRARPFSYIARGLEPPDVQVRVELEGPDGERWCFDDDHDAPHGTEAAVAGEHHGGQMVRGLAVDFCLVVTQRRHLDDTELVVQGDVARGWMAIAQAFAGPPGPGRSAKGSAKGSSTG